MRPILKYITETVLFLLLPFMAQAQWMKYVPTQVKLGTDLSYAGLSLLKENRSLYELNADIDFYRFLLTADFGLSDYDLIDESFNYNNSGSYYRAGLDYNLLKITPDENTIYLGMRYVASDYTENFNYYYSDPFYGDFQEDITAIKRNSRWFEMVLGMKVKVWDRIFLGWTGRFKFLKSTSSLPSSFGNYWIPAYGKGVNDTMWGLNYQIFYSLPVRKRKVTELENKIAEKKE